MNNQQDPLAFFKFFGVIPTKQVKDNHVATCPFIDCQKSGHFYFHQVTGLFQCKKCCRAGNYYTFITDFHSSLILSTTDSDYDYLQSERAIPSEVFKLACWARHPSTGKFYVPYYGGSGLLNLGAFDPTSYNPKNRFRIFKSPGMDLQLYQLFSNKSFDQEIIVTEGEWDALAFYSAFRAGRKECPTILGLPGATSWKESWIPRFKGKYLTFYYDNDKGGQDGIALLHKRSKGLRFSVANWEAPLLAKLKKIAKSPVPTDVRDIWQYAKVKTDVLPALLDMAATSKDDSIDDVQEEESEVASVKKSFSTDVDTIEPIKSHSIFQRRIKESLYTNRSILQTIDVMLATCLSVHLPGEPLWLFVVGPASCGKSTVIEAFGGNNKYFDYSSKLTATSMVSGWRTTDGSDASNLHKFNLKTHFIKDMTVLLGMPDGVQQQLWDLLRDAYDGYIKVMFGNGKIFEATDFKFNIIAGVTPIIYKHNDASKGERFLRIDFLGSDFDEDEHMAQAWSNQSQKKENKKKLCESILGYYKHLVESFDPTKEPTIPAAIRNKIFALSKLVARMQTQIEKDRNEGMIYRPVSAVATRLSLQFKNLVTALAAVRNETTVSEATYDIIRKVGFDSCPGLNFEVIDYIRRHKNVTRKSLINGLKIPSTRVHQILTDFEQLGILVQDKVSNGSGNRGRDTYTYTLSDEITQCLEDTHAKARPKVARLGKSTKGTSRKRLAVRGK
jgi:hypothetical protein